MKKNISQRDIAHLLGINVSTVSRALKDMPGVSSELRQKILAMAEERGYRPNPFAMSLRYGATRLIGIVVPDITFNHYAQIVKWIEDEAKQNGYLCIVTDSSEKYDSEVDCIEQLINMHVEGIALCLSQESVIAGTEGNLIIDNINNPQSITVNGPDRTYVETIRVPTQITGYEYQFLACRQAIADGLPEPREMPHAETLYIMQLMDTLRQKWGVRYPMD